MGGVFGDVRGQESTMDRPQGCWRCVAAAAVTAQTEAGLGPAAEASAIQRL